MEFHEGQNVLRDLLIFLRKPTFLRVRKGRGFINDTPVRNGQFASFMSVQGCSRSRHPDRHDRRLQTQKFMRLATMTAAAAGVAWVAAESARAFSIF